MGLFQGFSFFVFLFLFSFSFFFFINQNKNRGELENLWKGLPYFQRNGLIGLLLKKNFIFSIGCIGLKI